MPEKQHHLWRPPDFNRSGSHRIEAIRSGFDDLYPKNEYGHLSKEISAYWISSLKSTWEDKPEALRTRDLAYPTENPLSRIRQQTVLIAYADMVRKEREPTLATLKDFLSQWFPAIKGLHLLPSCEVNETRFNDGGFSQIRRDRIHKPYGTNDMFASMMEKHFSMTDFVLNHVDIDHPRFTAYLAGDDPSGDCFFTFPEEEYRKHEARGDFAAIFRPRPFPLFTIFRRNPVRGNSSHKPGWKALNDAFEGQGFSPLPETAAKLLEIFPKVQNDQMLLDEDAAIVSTFKPWLEKISSGRFDDLFTVSGTQETRHVPYIFSPAVQRPEDLLAAVLPCLGIAADRASAYAGILQKWDTEIFGEPVRVLTTFSHVQADLNTSTLEGLKLLADDFSWYLKMDLNMLRLDAANFAFKKWGTSCFGLPEVNKLLNILYLSMECVSPRMVPNLEVNAPLSAVLSQMAENRPPMMYDFHLASMLPAVFNTENARPLKEIFRLVSAYDIPSSCIRFSLDESHDGKSVSGSGGADPLLTYDMRRRLIDVVEENGGRVKYKSVPAGCCPAAEFAKICAESGLETESAAGALFQPSADSAGLLKMKAGIKEPEDAAAVLGISSERMRNDAALSFLSDKLFHGKEPYELCTSTWDSMRKLDPPELAARRYLALKTLAFALMGRHVKSVYFNDLLALPNDMVLMQQTGELRNIKRTKSSLNQLERLLKNPESVRGWIAGQMNDLVALADTDPALGPEAEEADLNVPEENPSLAIVHNRCRDDHSLVVVNTGQTGIQLRLDISCLGNAVESTIEDKISGESLIGACANGVMEISLTPFHRLWLKNRR